MRHLSPRWKELYRYLLNFDNGLKVKSVRMGGLSPEYEEAIQTLANETLSNLLSKDYPTKEGLFEKVVRSTCSEARDKLDKKFGFSGAQVGAAANLAAVFWKNGPQGGIDMMRDLEPSRIIEIVKSSDGFAKVIELKPQRTG